MCLRVSVGVRTCIRHLMGCCLQHLHGFLVNRRILPIVSFLQISETSGNIVSLAAVSAPQTGGERHTPCPRPFPTMYQESIIRDTALGNDREAGHTPRMALREAEIKCRGLGSRASGRGALKGLEAKLTGKLEHGESSGIRPQGHATPSRQLPKITQGVPSG